MQLSRGAFIALNAFITLKKNEITVVNVLHLLLPPRIFHFNSFLTGGEGGQGILLRH